MMINIVLTFIIGLALALVLTPFSKWLGKRIGAIDVPTDRNIHDTPIPRSGGLAVALSFILTLVVMSFFYISPSMHLSTGANIFLVALGAVIVFGVGLYDDVRRLRPKVKLLFQIIAASLAYLGGLKITTLAIGTFALNLGIMSYFITVFWFVLLINAMNLIDGLDGLAAGVAFFACVIMTVIAAGRSDYWTAIAFAALAGVLIGFLRYNFNPATIFLGDGGSYFIGYTIAALSINGSLKSGLATSLLIPLLALGVPIFDTLLAPVRRWLLGSRMFRPDKEHFHHHLLKRGLSSRNAVFLIYGVTLLLCIAGIIIINIRNSLVGWFLIILIVVLFIAVRKIGYLEYLAIDKILGWFRDVAFEAGLDSERRSFLNLQLQIERSDDIESLWNASCRAFEKLGIDRGELHYYKTPNSHDTGLTPVGLSYEGPERRQVSSDPAQCGLGGDSWINRFENNDEIIWLWTRGHCRRFDDVQKKDFFRMDLPLDIENSTLHKLILFKFLNSDKIEPYTMRRMIYLRKSISAAMKKIKEEGGRF